MSDLLEAMTGELVDFEDRARTITFAPERLTGARSAVARSRSIAWLVERLDSVLAREELTGLVEWSLAHRMKLERLVGDEPPDWTPARCRCGERSLRWDVQAGFYVCGACEAHVSEAEATGRVDDEAGAWTR
ncbi:hypothetical protein [Planotetraspora phitsanulokensis]|uniref:hypothetical protein n=1 Tax=Planotetraspora phitsanulokensis TaxID=575192 RepID=UPI00194DF62C|nr:hypothetical protein [Planotetraspora phitsanulokensis]